MIEKNLATVDNAISFRDVIMDMDRKGQQVHVRLHGFSAPTYVILPRHVDPFQKITLDGLFKFHWAPVYMEDFAQALPTMPDPDVQIDIFTME